MKILILEPYFTGSHKSWAEGFAKYSRHQVEILSLPGNFWKWRMHGGAVTMAEKYLASDSKPDLLLATDMLDLTTFLSLTRKRTSHLPIAVYFHENQLTYPWSPTDRDVVQKRDKHYGFINYTTALAANAVLFNSDYHRQSFLSGLSRFLKHFPDYNGLENIPAIEKKSQVLPLGLDLSGFDRYKKDHAGEDRLAAFDSRPPLILWNHRWEFDKNPGEFFRALSILAEEGLDFRIAILGECFSKKPGEFEEARQHFGDRIVHYGFVENFADYAAWLWRSDILPVTSYQDFFGASVAEALYCGCHALLPKRLAYPELLPHDAQDAVFYLDFDDLIFRLKQKITNRAFQQPAAFRDHIGKYDWRHIVSSYDDVMNGLG